jgi:hypothetical protein
MVSVFGKPFANDNASAAFLTSNAINNTLYRSFVSYPVVTDWEEASIFLNGTYQTYWVPVSAGAVIVYAPYNSSLNLSSAKTNLYAQQINAKVRFTAFSSVAQTLYIDEPTANSTRTVANIRVTTIPEAYSFNVPLISGPEGNPLFFLYRSNSTPILLQNISFSR